MQGGQEDAGLGWDRDLDWEWVYGMRREKVRAGYDARSMTNLYFMAHGSVPWTTCTAPCLPSRCGPNAVISTTVDGITGLAAAHGCGITDRLLPLASIGRIYTFENNWSVGQQK